MHNDIDLYVWLALTTAFSLLILTPIAQIDAYIVHMDISFMPKAFSTCHTWHLSTLSSALVEFKTTNSVSAAEAASSKLLYSYTHAVNGSSARLTPEFEILKASPGFVSAVKDVRMEADTTHSTSFLGLSPNSGPWKASNYGEGMIIGVIDSGVWPESKSYNDKGMPKIPKRWRGQCESGLGSNKKLIGARSFNKGVIASDPTITIPMNSPRDTNGNVTHTSSTEAGNFVGGASYFGYAMGRARGAAPRAHLAVYKALWGEGNFASDIIATIDQAIVDQVDVSSISVSEFLAPLYEDPIALATFAAVEKNIAVASSARNRGPFGLTVRNVAPWVITVAAGTTDRKFNAVMKLGKGVALTGGNVVVCEETFDTPTQFQFGTAEGTNVAAGVLITNSTELGNFFPSRFPAIFMNLKDSEKLKKYIRTNTKPQVSIEFKRTSLSNKAALSIAAYSSRGPSRFAPDVLKPEIVAPGTLILAAKDGRFFSFRSS